MIIKGWETDNITVQMNDTVLQEKKDFWIGQRSGLDREDLIVWVNYKSLKTSRILISRK